LERNQSAGVVEVLASGKQLNALGVGAGKDVEESGMQALLEKNVRRDDLEHVEPVGAL
jgi:hypothetical protein